MPRLRTESPTPGKSCTPHQTVSDLCLNHASSTTTVRLQLSQPRSSRVLLIWESVVQSSLKRSVVKACRPPKWVASCSSLPKLMPPWQPFSYCIIRSDSTRPTNWRNLPCVKRFSRTRCLLTRSWRGPSLSPRPEVTPLQSRLRPRKSKEAT